MSELARIARLRALLAREAPDVRVGIGDDAAVLALTGAAGALVWTVDAQVEGTHFRTAWATWEDVGFRSFMAAASDLAAMGAEPVGALSALVLAPSFDDAALEALARGQAEASLAVGAPIVGGNLARGSETSITTTLLGRTSHPVLRNGARPGDGLWLAGPVGLAAAGLALLMQDASMQNASMQDARGEAISAIPAAHRAACLAAWRRPVARIAAGRGLSRASHAAIDISDGLAHDAWQLAEASHVRVVLDAAAILAAAGESLTSVAAGLGRDPVDLALHGGEDYAVLAASPSPLPGFLQIGIVEAEARQGSAPGGGARVSLRTANGTEPVAPRGFDHFG